MKNFLRKCSTSKIEVFSKKIASSPLVITLCIVSHLGKAFDKFEKAIELFLLWVSLFPATWENVNNRHFLNESIQRKKINRSQEALVLAKISIERIIAEYEDRKKTSSEKTKILFQTITFVFTINTGLLAYLYKGNNGSLNILFVVSLALLVSSLFMIIIYYKVSAANSITFEEEFNEGSIFEYYSDLLFCVEMNNNRLDYFVTIYKSSVRFFILAIIFLLLAVVSQFYTTVNLQPFLS